MLKGLGSNGDIHMNKQLNTLLSKKEFLSAGLMSGTSMDGVDAVLVRLKAAPEKPAPEVLAFETVPYPEALKESLMDLAMGQQCSAEDIAILNTGVAVAFSKGFFEVCRVAGTEPGDVDFIGSHGQTVAHVSSGAEKPIAGTLQIGSPGMIAAFTGVTTIGDFRAGDIALGGQGAPLAPYVDYLMRKSPKFNRIILNIGGIANLTYLPKKSSRHDVIAFDTGPGNMVLDAAYRALYPGDGEYDTNGDKAKKGKANIPLVEQFLSHPYFKRRPPKSAGHNEFGVNFTWEFLARARETGITKDDTLASATMLTARSIGEAIQRYVEPEGDVDQVYVSGGGLRNETLVNELREMLAPAQVHPIDELGIAAEAKEAVDFAVLARETILGRPNVIAAATGAPREIVLGVIAIGRKQETG